MVSRVSSRQTSDSGRLAWPCIASGAVTGSRRRTVRSSASPLTWNGDTVTSPSRQWNATSPPRPSLSDRLPCPSPSRAASLLNDRAARPWGPFATTRPSARTSAAPSPRACRSSPGLTTQPAPTARGSSRPARSRQASPRHWPRAVTLPRGPGVSRPRSRPSSTSSPVKCSGPVQSPGHHRPSPCTRTSPARRWSRWPPCTVPSTRQRPLPRRYSARSRLSRNSARARQAPSR